MNCTQCDIGMHLVKQETTTRSIVKWHRCPNCGRAHLIAEPSAHIQPVSNTHSLLSRLAPARNTADASPKDANRHAPRYA